MKKTTVLKKAMYGTSMKPSMMKSGGNTKMKKMGSGGMHMMPDGSMMSDAAMMPPMQKGSVKKYGEGEPTDPNKYVMNKTNVFGNYKHKEISKNKFDRLSNRYTKQEGSESLGDNKSIGQQVISGRNPKKSVSRIDEVKKAELNKNRMPPMKTGGAKPKAMYGASMKPDMMKKGGAAGTALKNALIKNGYKKGGSTKK